MGSQFFAIRSLRACALSAVGLLAASGSAAVLPASARSTSAIESRASAKERLVKTFFSNYALIATAGFDSFRAAQSSLLAEQLITRVDFSDGKGKRVYYGRGGYFRSLEAFSARIKTGPTSRPR